MNLSYTAWVALFGLAGLGWVLWRTCRSLADVADALAQIFLIGLAALVCGRIGYVLLNLDFFAPKPSAILSGSYPGLAEQTALLGAWLAFKFLRNRIFARNSISEFSFILLAALVGVGASVGCIQAGCAYGREVFWQDGGMSGIGWLLRADLPDAYSIPNPRWPTQAMMVVWLMVLLLVFLAQRRRDAEIKSNPLRLRVCAVSVFFAFFLIGDFFMQFFRADPASGVMFGLRGSQGLDVVVFGLVAILHFATMRPAHKRD